MIKKETVLHVGDNSGLKRVRCFHHYFGSQKLTSFTGDFLKVSVRARKYRSKWLKTKTVYTLKKGKKIKVYVIRTRYKTNKIDGSRFFFQNNEILTLKKRMTSRAKYTYGPFSYNHGRKKVLDSFAGII